MKISIIVPTLNEEKNIAETLSYLRKNAPADAELIVSDGHSTDHTRDIAKKYADKIVLESKKKHNKSIAAGRNKGAESAKGEILVFVDADTKPDPAFFRKMLPKFDDPNIIGVGCKIMPESLGFMDTLLFEFLNLLIRMSVLVNRPSIAGNCVAYRKTAFNKIKGFDETMFASEDQDLCLRISKLGKVIYMPDVTAWTSSRRLKKMGWLGLAMDWGHTTFNFLLGIKTKRYAIVREI